MRHTKIVATIGPATSGEPAIRALIAAGVDVCRLNFSHGTHEAHGVAVRTIRAAADALGRSVAIMQDLSGPKIRTGLLRDGQPIALTPGDELRIAVGDFVGERLDAAGTLTVRVSTPFADLPKAVQPADRLLLDDGRIQLRVERVEGDEIVTIVVDGGLLGEHKGINAPGVMFPSSALTDKDIEDLKFGVSVGVDLVALSFVHSGADLRQARDVTRAAGAPGIPLIAKLERPEAIARLDEILHESDAVMVARGDLGLELPLERVPRVQKEVTRRARALGIPVIVATQVLESMISAPRPTRAEASDCANAVLDGADAVMLSGETSVGDYPIETVRTMARIIEATEEMGRERMAPLGSTPHTRGGVITRAAAEIGEVLDVKYLVTFTQSGDSARRMSRLRSNIPLLAFTPAEDVRNVLSLSWGLQTYRVPAVEDTDAMVSQVDSTLRANGLAEIGDYVVVVAGAPVGVVGSTNSIVVHKIGDEENVSGRIA